nr:CopG family ribbon-helix-helix protein [Candidatus Sigynarchaeota archaeon]
MFEDKDMDRVSVTIPKALLGRLDEYCEDLGTNRSGVVRDAIRAFLNKSIAKDPAAFIDGFVIVSFNHHRRGLLDELTDIEHHSKLQIYSTLHVHVGPENCSEVIAIKGKTGEVKDFFDKIQALKGILMAELVPLYTYDHKDTRMIRATGEQGHEQEHDHDGEKHAH